jgi:predicted GH43/DUF377 family glycosyl hydrolase
LRGPELFERYAGNPILTADAWPYTVNAVFNPAVTRFDGETLLLVRVEDRTGMSHLCVARSRDGVDQWRIEPETRLLPDLGSEAERYGIEDPRITLCGDEYIIVYTGYSNAGPLVRLASTRDFKTFEPHGTLMPPEDKDAALFPHTFDGRWALLHRPVAMAPRHMAHIWPAAAPDRARLAAALPRRPRHRRRLDLPARPRASRCGAAPAGARALERVDLRPRRAV